jgi:dipeptidyl aminopeptidase/acylaminoacyl peptidase
MTISWLNTLTTAALASALTACGGPAFGGPFGVGGRQESAKSVRDAGAGQVAPTPPGDENARAVSRFGDVLRRHPARRAPQEGTKLRLYMMDLVAGGTTLIADEPEPGFNCCLSPKWSHGGTRIIFGTWPAERPEACRIKAIEVHDGLPRCVDLGPGNSPTFSPDDQRIAFALGFGSEPGREAGVWIMQADGSGRRRVSEYIGAPFWSPDGREFLLCDFSERATVINLETREAGVIAVPGHQTFSWPSWAGPGTLITALASGRDGDAIALLDVSKPAEAKIIEVLWKRGDDLDVAPRWPVYQADRRRCIFVGEEPMKRTLLSVRRGGDGRVERLEPRGYNDKLGGLAFSPDGRYLLFCADRPDRP